MSLNQLNQPLLLSGDPDEQQQHPTTEGQHYNRGDSQSYNHEYNYSNYKYGSLEAPNHSHLPAEENHDKQNYDCQHYQDKHQPLSPPAFMPVKFTPNQAARKQGSSSSYLKAGHGGVMSSKFKWLTIGLLLIISLVCLYGVWSWHQASSSAALANGEPFRRNLKMVNLFTRHGDRAPSDRLPLGDRHGEQVSLFWPHGLHNLTDIGRLRAYKTGLEMRRRYDDYLGYNSSHILAFSSTIYRCIETMEIILQALYNTETTLGHGLLLAQELESCQATSRDDLRLQQHRNKCRMPTGSGSPDEWRRVNIDTMTVPTLVYERLNACKYRKDHPSPIDQDLMLDPAIKSLSNVKKMKEFLEQRYEHVFNFSTNALWSTVNSELNLIRTQSTIDYIQHYSDWVNAPIIQEPKFNVTMFDLLEEVTVLLYKDRIQGPARYIQNSPVVTSLIESQLMALGYNATNDRQEAYKNKRMILYSSHDSVLQQFLQSLNLINFEGSYEQRFANWHKASDLDQFLNGLRMCRYGLSVRFELWQLEPLGKHRSSHLGPSNRMATNGRSSVSGSQFRDSANCKDSINSKKRNRLAFNIVEAAIYNKEDAKFEGVEYKLIELGTACRKQFMRNHPGPNGREELESFYDSDFEIDTRFACPFNLFRNVTSELMLDEEKLEQLCHYSSHNNTAFKTTAGSNNN